VTPEATQVQLKLIAEVTSLLTAATIPHWLFGGWAVDFLVGEVTRPHSDIEFAVWRSDFPAVRRLLRRQGYADQGVEFTQEAANLRKNGQLLRLIFIERNERGEVVTPGPWSDWPWPDGSFGGARGRLGDIELPVVSPQGQLDTKDNYHRHPAGRPLRPKDRADLEHLRRLVDKGQVGAS
jgi:hypothetical protein